MDRQTLPNSFKVSYYLFVFKENSTSQSLTGVHGAGVPLELKQLPATLTLGPGTRVGLNWLECLRTCPTEARLSVSPRFLPLEVLWRLRDGRAVRVSLRYIPPVKDLLCRYRLKRVTGLFKRSLGTVGLASCTPLTGTSPLTFRLRRRRVRGVRIRRESIEQALQGLEWRGVADL